MKKKLSAIIAALCLLSTAVAPCLAAFNQESMNSVVLITAELIYNVSDGQNVTRYPDNEHSWRGTAFFIGERGKDPQYLVTNHHVLSDYITAHERGTVQTNNGLVFDPSPSIISVYYDEDTREEAYVVYYNTDLDIAFLRLDRPTDKRQALSIQCPTSSDIGRAAYAIGFPGVADQVLSATTAWGLKDLTVTSGSVSRLLTESGTGRKLVQMDVPISGGNSGGPLVNEAGNVIGVNTMGASSVETVNYALNSEELIPLLKSNSIPFDLITPTNPLIYVLAAAAAVLVLAVILFLVLRARKGRNGQEAGKKAGKKEKGKAAKNTEPSGQTGTDDQPAPPPPTPQLQPILRSLSAQHNGMMLALDASPVLIGRDASTCRVVFAEGTPGVSARHCSVSYEPAAKEFLLTDVGSTYGTFLATGQQITVGVPCRLRSGDTFYLGDRSNALRVELG